MAVIKLDEVNKNFVNEVIEAGKLVLGEDIVKSIKACYQCGTCTGSCPSGRRTAYRTRKVLRKVLLGLDDVLDSDDIWYCTTCYTCYERCPRDVKITEIIKTLRNIAAQKGNMALAHRKTASYVLRFGHAVPANNQIVELRGKLGLPAKSPTAQFSEKDLEEVRTLIKELKFDKLIAFDWEKMDLKE
ncbi:TPA: CoB--CoM heterodisulfide reductase subunit C [Methanocaldococcus jannaschii]|uniref:CoB--CoM heterodisulfide reductase iron-sulfur subunit C 2 n=2 Tax=Methanocaldococcus jannaschii TaxID=2190 RepID=HDRC2_METJA|nr:CoB--CoM heterodisulfide reductase subunit C [Methanocaldococcus jannaschii]Q58274.1 RecName: Full=CoB--CoM heterodisulfide reductase iron-sulfur subunit C 2 [Methanocaldococcus jannaschii DSM 2661]AAB98869.1 heterodisulfide reductase, subunit C2 (hdrC2) [Methanocaldococcus jannaschii DSM 2661]HII59032.1 CoB--CoM heterodisulfide reductase subunit C [Methanocaldococcus jannaschii]